jgi:protein-tyrosine phosphatase
VDWILPDIAVGSIEDAMAHEMLRSEGIQSVLTVNDFPTLSGMGFNWRRVSLIDGPGNAPGEVTAAVEALEELHRTAPAVLVHCAEGKSRSVLIVSLYIARLRRVPLPEAFELVKRSRTEAAVDHELWKLGLEVHIERAGGS